MMTDKKGKNRERALRWMELLWGYDNSVAREERRKGKVWGVFRELLEMSRRSW